MDLIEAEIFRSKTRKKQTRDSPSTFRGDIHETNSQCWPSYSVVVSVYIVSTLVDLLCCVVQVKQPGLEMSAVQSELDLSYRQRYQGVVIPEAYERLILDT